MATNDFLPFANGGAANVLTQSAYAALTSLLQNGFSAGVAPSVQLNKVWRQSSIMAAVLAQFAADYSGNNSTDDGTTVTLEANLLTAIRNAAKTGVILADTGAVNAYTAVNVPPLVAGTWVDGVVQQVKIAHANTGASTYAPDGLTAIPIYGLGLQPLQGGELALNGTAVLMHATIAGVNSGSPIAVLMECFGGAQQVPPATASQHAVQLGQVAGVVGSVRNLVMSVTAASATATLTADEIIVETALGGLRYCLANFNKTINLATTGAGGMDTGTAPVSGYVALYAIWNPTTSTAALLATNATSAVQPNVYGGANMPSGYTASALISVRSTNASGQFTIGTQRDRRISFALTPMNSNSTPTGTYTSFSVTTIPKNAIEVTGVFDLAGGASVVVAGFIASDANGTGEQHTSVNTGGGCSGNFANLAVLTAQTLFYKFTNSAGGGSYGVSVSSYTI